MPGRTTHAPAAGTWPRITRRAWPSPHSPSAFLRTSRPGMPTAAAPAMYRCCPRATGSRRLPTEGREGGVDGVQQLLVTFVLVDAILVYDAYELQFAQQWRVR